MGHPQNHNLFYLGGIVTLIGAIGTVGLILGIINTSTDTNNVSPATLEARGNTQAYENLLDNLEFLCFGTDGIILSPEAIPVRARELCDCVNERLPTPFKPQLLVGLRACMCEVINDRCGPPNLIRENGVCSPGFRNVCPN